MRLSDLRDCEMRLREYDVIDALLLVYFIGSVSASPAVTISGTTSWVTDSAGDFYLYSVPLRNLNLSNESNLSYVECFF